MRLPKLKLGELIEVEWVDAVSDSAWFERKDFKWPEMRATTIGYYLDKCDIAIVVVDSLFDDYEKENGTVGGFSTIPLGMITAVRKIE